MAQPCPVRLEDCARRKPSSEVEAEGKLSTGFVHTHQSLSSSQEKKPGRIRAPAAPNLAYWETGGCADPLCPPSVPADRSLQFALPEGARVRHFLGTELIYFKFSFMFAAKAISPHPPPLCLLPRSLAAQSRWCVF